MSDITMREIAKGVWLPTAWPADDDASEHKRPEGHAAVCGCIWCNPDDSWGAPRGLSPRPAGGEVEEEAAAAAPPLTVGCHDCAARGAECDPCHAERVLVEGADGSRAAPAAPPSPAKTNWSEWKMVSNTEQPAELYKYTWFTSVRGWRTAHVGEMLVIEVRLFSDNIFRHMIPRIKVRGLIARTHPAAHQYNVIVNSYGRHPDLKFKFLDSDNALEFQMDLCKVLYG